MPGRQPARREVTAVIFDLGGVVFPSPFDAFASYERDHGLPDRFIRTVVAESADHGAWARLERNEVDFPAFCAEFEAECAAAGGSVDAAELMRAVGARLEPRPRMIVAIERIRARELKTAALTNNWAPTSAREPRPELGSALFDVVVESAVEGVRKPDPRIYELVCERLMVSPERTVFLDDLGVNLKPARELGMQTIKVVDHEAAIDELADVLGFALH